MNEILWSAVLRDYVYLTDKLSILVIFSLFFTPSALHFSVSFFFLHAMNDEHDDTIVTSTH